jgi:4-alpha-glucanotransferase
MNVPGVAAGNWLWQLEAVPADPALVAGWRDMLTMYGRVPAA